MDEKLRFRKVHPHSQIHSGFTAWSQVWVSDPGSYLYYSSVEVGKNLLCYFRFSSWVMRIKAAKDRLTGEKIYYACTCGPYTVQFSSVQSQSRVRLFATPWIAARQASLSITNSRSSLRLTAIESMMPSSHLILCHPLLLLPPIPPSIRLFSNESTLRIRWPKYWSFSWSRAKANRVLPREHTGHSKHPLSTTQEMTCVDI